LGRCLASITPGIESNPGKENAGIKTPSPLLTNDGSRLVELNDLRVSAIGTPPRPSVPPLNSTGLPGQGVPDLQLKIWQSWNAGNADGPGPSSANPPTSAQASRTIPRSPCPQSGWRSNVTEAPDPVRLRGLFLFRPPLPPCAMIRCHGSRFVLADPDHRRRTGRGLHALESDLPGLWTHCRCPVAAADRAEGHHPGHTAREYPPTVPTMRECHPDDRCPSTQHCLEPRKQRPWLPNGQPGSQGRAAMGMGGVGLPPYFANPTISQNTESSIPVP
jgi:hypothetical protein